VSERLLKKTADQHQKIRGYLTPFARFCRDLPALGPEDPQRPVHLQGLGHRAAEYPTFSLLLTEIDRKQYVGSALRWLAGNSRTKDAVAVLDALEMLDGDRIAPARSRSSPSGRWTILKGFKHIEAPKEINVAVLRAAKSSTP